MPIHLNQICDTWTLKVPGKECGDVIEHADLVFWKKYWSGSCLYRHARVLSTEHQWMYAENYCSIYGYEDKRQYYNVVLKPGIGDQEDM